MERKASGDARQYWPSAGARRSSPPPVPPKQQPVIVLPTATISIEALEKEVRLLWVALEDEKDQSAMKDDIIYQLQQESAVMELQFAQLQEKVELLQKQNGALLEEQQVHRADVVIVVPTQEAHKAVDTADLSLPTMLEPSIPARKTLCDGSTSPIPASIILPSIPQPRSSPVGPSLAPLHLPTGRFTFSVPIEQSLARCEAEECDARLRLAEIFTATQQLLYSFVLWQQEKEAGQRRLTAEMLLAQRNELRRQMSAMQKQYDEERDQFVAEGAVLDPRRLFRLFQQQVTFCNSLFIEKDSAFLDEVDSTWRNRWTYQERLHSERIQELRSKLTMDAERQISALQETAEHAELEKQRMQQMIRANMQWVERQYCMTIMGSSSSSSSSSSSARIGEGAACSCWLEAFDQSKGVLFDCSALRFKDHKHFNASVNWFRIALDVFADYVIDKSEICNAVLRPLIERCGELRAERSQGSLFQQLAVFRQQHPPAKQHERHRSPGPLLVAPQHPTAFSSTGETLHINSNSSVQLDEQLRAEIDTLRLRARQTEERHAHKSKLLQSTTKKLEEADMQLRKSTQELQELKEVVSKLQIENKEYRISQEAMKGKLETLRSSALASSKVSVAGTPSEQVSITPQPHMASVPPPTNTISLDTPETREDAATFLREQLMRQGKILDLIEHAHTSEAYQNAIILFDGALTDLRMSIERMLYDEYKLVFKRLSFERDEGQINLRQQQAVSTRGSLVLRRIASAANAANSLGFFPEANLPLSLVGFTMLNERDKALHSTYQAKVNRVALISSLLGGGSTSSGSGVDPHGGGSGDGLSFPSYLVDQELEVQQRAEAQESFVAAIEAVSLEVKRELNKTLLVHHHSLFAFFELFAPPQQMADHLRVQVVEGALNLVVAQRDQSVSVAHWLVTQCTSASNELSDLLHRTVDMTRPFRLDGGNDLSMMMPEDRRGDNGIVSGSNTAVDQMHSATEDLKNTAAVGEFHSICDRLINGIEGLHKRLLRTELSLQSHSSALREKDAAAEDLKKCLDDSTLAGCVERQISDDALLALREDLAEERDATGESLTVLLEECADRNICIRELQQHVVRNSLNSHAGMLIAQYLWCAWETTHASLGQQLYRVYSRAKLAALPTSNEMMFHMLVVHFSLGEALTRASTDVYSLFGEYQVLVNKLTEQRLHYEHNVVSMAEDLRTAARERRIEAESMRLLDYHARELFFESLLSTRQSMEAVLHEMLRSLRQQVSLSFSATSALEVRERELRAAAKTIAELQSIVDEHRVGSTAVEQSLLLLQTQCDEHTQQTKKLERALKHKEDDLEQCSEQLQTSISHVRTLEKLLAAEKLAHDVAHGHEVAYLKEKDQLQVAVRELETDNAKLKQAVDRERESHRATIRSFAQQQYVPGAQSTSTSSK